MAASFTGTRAWVREYNSACSSYILNSLVYTLFSCCLNCFNCNLFPSTDDHVTLCQSKYLLLVSWTTVCILLGMLFCYFLVSPTSFTFYNYYKDDHSLVSQRFDLRTFSRDGLLLPPRQLLQPDFSKLPQRRNFKAKTSEFVKLNLVKTPWISNYLMKQLTTSEEVIREGQRIQFHIYEQILGNFKYAMWFGLAAYENKGDSCVTTGEAYILKRLGIKVVFFCNSELCTDARMDEAKALSRNYTIDELVIVGRGGGNLIGYFSNDEIRFRMLDRFPNHKIVIFPQGIWVPNDDLKTSNIIKARERYCCHENLTIILRERPSYNLAKVLFNGTTRLLMAPDSAFQFGPIPRFMNPVFDILWLKRDDNEGTANFTLPRHPPHLRVHMSQWWKWKTSFGRNKIERAYYLATNGFFYLQRGRVVVTDRLHGHVVSVLLNIPHVIIDPKGRKATNFHYTWTKSLNNVAVAKDPEEAMVLAIQMLEKFKHTLPPRMPYLHLRENTASEKNSDAHPDSLP